MWLTNDAGERRREQTPPRSQVGHRQRGHPRCRFFGAGYARERLSQVLVLHGLLAENALQLTHLVFQRTTLADRNRFVACQRQPNGWFGADPCMRATRVTLLPSRKVISTMREFSSPHQP